MTLRSFRRKVLGAAVLGTWLAGGSVGFAQSDLSWDGVLGNDDAQYGPATGSVWSTTAVAWLPGSTHMGAGSTNQAWNNTGFKNAQFKSLTGGTNPGTLTITLGESINLGVLDKGGSFAPTLVITNAPGNNFAFNFGGASDIRNNNAGAAIIIDVPIAAVGSTGLKKSLGGTAILSQNNTYTGLTVINAAGGTLQIGNGGTTGTLGVGEAQVGTGGILAFKRSNVLEVSNLITGAGRVDQTGTGTTTLTAANLYAGGTNVTTGRLLANNASGSGTGAGGITVSQNAILGGTGAVGGSGAVHVINGILQMGDHTGTLAAADFGVAGNTTIGATGSMQFDLFANKGGSSNVVAVDSDLLLATGTAFAISNGSSVLVNSQAAGIAGWAIGDSWKLIDWGSGVAVTAGNFTFGSNIDAALAAQGLRWDFSNLFQTSGALAGSIVLAAVPEPSVALLGGWAMVVGLVLHRRRR